MKLQAGIHYVAIEAENRILLPELSILRGLRHKWFWEARERPYVPVWNFVKMPRPTLPAEENCRLLSLYMRPWTLNPSDITPQNPLLTDLRVTLTIGETSQSQTGKEDKQCDTPQDNRPRANNDRGSKGPSYVGGWQQYLDGNVVSETNRTYIQNLLMATAARVVEEENDDASSSDDDLPYNRSTRDIGSMDLVQKTLQGIAADDEDAGQEGFGQYSDTIALGRSVWQSPDITNAEAELLDVAENGYVLSATAAKKAVEKHSKEANSERAAPFAHATQPSSTLKYTDYVVKLQKWFQKLSEEREQPNAQQFVVLEAVRDRLLTEVELDAVGPSCYVDANQKRKREDSREDPLRGLTHGGPGTGKSRVIKWIVRMFTEGMGWQHGKDFVCVAFQNKVAHAMAGSTLHSAGDIKIGQQSYSAMLESRDIDGLFTKNECLRWVLFDEIFMIPDDLLGMFAKNYQEAAPRSQFNRYFRRTDGEFRILGGLNFMMFGDMQQLPPIPSSAALFIPPAAKTTVTANEMLNIFWGTGADALNFFKELTIQQRTADPWYRCFLQECRAGALSDEMYNFLMGLPTRHCGSWLPDGVSDDLHEDPFLLRCYDDNCASLHETWADNAEEGASWAEILAQQPECIICRWQRLQRSRLVKANDPRVLQEPFLAAPYVHQNNQPKYHAMLLRAVEWAKRANDRPQQILWVRAQDTPGNPKEIGRTPEAIDKKLTRFLQFHDQKTGGIPGLMPLFQAGWSLNNIKLFEDGF